MVAYVSQEREHIHAEFFALVRHLIELRFFFPRDENQISTFARERERDCLAIVAAAAGYQRCLTL